MPFLPAADPVPPTCAITPLPEDAQLTLSATAQTPVVQATDHVDAVIIKLQQRELLEPLLLLSAGYMALPFLLRQALLLLTPVLAVCGLVFDQEEPVRGL